jgi:molecular chaperone GrpE
VARPPALSGRTDWEINTVSEPIDSGPAPQNPPPGAESVSAAPNGAAPSAAAEISIDDTPAAAPEPDAQQRRIDLLTAQLDESARRARETNERLREEHERLLRTAAEFENFKRRAAKEKEDIGKFAVERLLKDFLPVADNLERALDHAEQHDPKVVIDGVRLVQKMLDQAFGKHGVTSFSAVGAAFDPNSHEALMQAESDLAPGTVVSEMAKGYRLHERLVRPAAVVVAKPRPAPEAAAGGVGDAGPGDGSSGAGQA